MEQGQAPSDTRRWRGGRCRRKDSRAFLQSAEGKQLIKGKPVITVVACRNMWLSAQQAMQEMIADAGGRLLDHIAFTDRGHPLATFITTPRWVLTGRRNPFLGLPAAGVAPDEIAAADRFGKAIGKALMRGDEQGNQPLLRGLRAVTVNPRLAISERAGRRQEHQDLVGGEASGGVLCRANAAENAFASSRKTRSPSSRKRLESHAIPVLR